MEMHAILAQYGLPYRYPKHVEEAAEKISAEITEQDLAEREDFRDVFTCTVDPKDAKDFDDALSIRKLRSEGVKECRSVDDTLRPQNLKTSEPDSLSGGDSGRFPTYGTFYGYETTGQHSRPVFKAVLTHRHKISEKI